MIAHDRRGESGAVGEGCRRATWRAPPQGGDTDQIKAVAAGECGVAVTNNYYFARLLRSTKPEDQEWSAKVGFVWPDQAERGTHINISGGGVAKNAPQQGQRDRVPRIPGERPAAQSYFADGNNEWPAVKGTQLNNPQLASLGSFKQESVSISSIGKNQIAAQRILDRVGYK